MEKLNLLQINTASEALRNALNNKKGEISKKMQEDDMKKHQKEIEKFYKKAVDLRKDAEKLKDKLEKESGLTINLGKYGGWQGRLPETIKEANEDNIVQEKDDAYKVELKKETKEVEDFILGLKLGTALMTDLQPLLNKINNIK